MRKPTSALETKLDEAQQAQLADWLLGGMKYHEAVPVIEKEFGLKLGGGWKNQLSKFWDSVCVPHALQHRRRAVDTSNEIRTEAAARPGSFAEATVERLQQLAFELSMSPNPNPKDVKALFMLVLKAGDQQIERRKLAIVETREKAKDAVESAAQKLELTPDVMKELLAAIDKKLLGEC